jgi:hypothetical protein
MILDRLKTSLGILCLAASLLLMSPGVRVVWADEARPVVEPEEAVPARTGDETDPAPGGEIDSPAGSPDDVIVLNTRGYNYGPDRPTVEPTMPSTPAAPAE